MSLDRITDELARGLARLRFGLPVSHVYNPLEYARKPYREYLSRFGKRPRQIVLVGMNPGPWGMAQTGVPFGEVDMVKNWLGIDGEVGTPQPEHPKKRIEGFRCRRSEVSGRRLWGLFRELCGTPGRFFGRFFVVNYWPLLFLDADGRNITPDKLKSGERAPPGRVRARPAAVPRAAPDPGRVPHVPAPVRVRAPHRQAQAGLLGGVPGREGARMNWSDERYVRVYTRDTPDWVGLGWEAQALFLLLLRKVDRAGVIELGRRGEAGLADLLRMPLPVVERALSVLIYDGCVTRSHTTSQLVVPNFLTAQEARQTDKHR